MTDVSFFTFAPVTYYNWTQLIIGGKTDFLPHAHTHVFIIVPPNEGACFFVCLLSALFAALFALQTLCSIHFNMLDIYPIGIVKCVHVHMMI